MKVQIFSDADEVAKAAAQFIASEAWAAVKARGRFTMVVSGGKTPWQMLRVLANEEVPWKNVQVVQLDERIEGPELAWDLVQTFHAAEFSRAARHLRRLGKVAALEAGQK